MVRELNELKQISQENFSSEEWEYLRSNNITNGFGPSSHPIIGFFLRKIAPLLKEASANIHDWNYYIGGNEEDRKKADFGFYKRIVEDVYSDDNKRTLYYASLAYVFFLAVRFFGKGSFSYTK